VLQFEIIDTFDLEPGSRRATRPQLPLYVEPAPEEALLSWLLRLAARLRVSLRALVTSGFGVDDRTLGTRWWCRPPAWLLVRINERTSVSLARLREMTFEDVQPVYRDDEASGRFTGRRYDSLAVKSRGYRFVVCGECLKNDHSTYLRRLWLLGWMAVCPDHGTILIERCSACDARLRVAPFATRASFSPATCARCGAHLLREASVPAHPSVRRLQAALLRGKFNGTVELAGLGEFTWKEIVALADVLIGMVWTDLTVADQEQLWLPYVQTFRHELRQPTDIFGGRHDSLCFLAWLIDGWPHGEGPTVAKSLLARWFSAERNRLCRHVRSPWDDPWSFGPTNFGSTIQQRLRALVGVP
jgi:hypothetical protein